MIHDKYKDRILKAKDIDSEVTGRSHGHPVRGLRNKMTREYLKLEAEGASFEQLENLTLGGLRKAVVEGDTDNGSVRRTDRRNDHKETELSGDRG